MPMQSVKGSVIPIETINDGVAASAATLIYCGAKKRYTFPLASFILHPSAAPNIKSEWVRPNELALLKKMLKTAINISERSIKPAPR